MRKNIKYTIPSLLEDVFKKHLDRNGFSFVGGKQKTYKDLQEDIAIIGNLLKDKGIQKGDKVVILGLNSPTWVATYYALATMGVVSVPILPDFSETEIISIIEHSEAKAIFVSSKLYPKIFNHSFNNVNHIFRLDGLAEIPLNTPPEKIGEILNIEGNSTNFEYEDMQEDDLLTIIYTSGTTGSSKGVMLSHKNIIYNTFQGIDVQEVNENDRFLSVLPLSHTFENTLGMNIAMVSGAAVYYLEKPPTPSILLPAFKKIKPTLFLSVPLIIEKIYTTKVLPEINNKFITRLLYKTSFGKKFINKKAGEKIYESFGGCLKFFGIGGAKLDPTVEQFLLDSKFPYSIGYGMTETSPLLAGTPVGKTKVGSTGETVSNMDIRLSKENPNDTDGEIQVKGANVMLGYYKNPEATNEVFTEDGWLRTGDLASIDKNNYIYIKGRSKNMLLGASGENIYPEEIESVINKNELVSESLVTQVGGKLVAMVHLNMDELENRVKRLQSNVNTMKDDAIQKTDEAKTFMEDKAQEILSEMKSKVNAELNKFSQIQKMILHRDPFEKTPTQKIKRFLYKKDTE